MNVFVHKYKWSHDSKRKKYKKLLKEGKVTLLGKEYWGDKHIGWLYEEKT